MPKPTGVSGLESEDELHGPDARSDAAQGHSLSSDHNYYTTCAELVQTRAQTCHSIKHIDDSWSEVLRAAVLRRLYMMPPYFSPLTLLTRFLHSNVSHFKMESWLAALLKRAIVC